MSLNNYDTIATARRFINEKSMEGVGCPCCDQFVKHYKRTINSSIARGLIHVVKTQQLNVDFKLDAALDGVLGAKTIYPQLSLCKYWGLLKPIAGIRDDGSDRIGLYQNTEKGIKFVNHEIKVLSHVELFNDKQYGFDGKQISIIDALGTKFDYKELMGGY